MKQGRLEWEVDGIDWPHRAASRFVQAGGTRWHVQIAGAGPAVLLVHGTGSAAHSWRHLLPLLSKQYTVIAPDLPGHGFSGPPANGRYGLDDLAHGLAALTKELALVPHIVAGNSAGAAIVARYALDTASRPARLVSINGALLPLSGVSGFLFPPLARVAAASPLIAKLFAHTAGDPRAVERMVQGTGSRIDAPGIACYRRLLQSPAHVEAVLKMMSHWRLERLAADLAGLTSDVVLLVGGQDSIVPPATAELLRLRLPRARLSLVPGRGHLLHEEDAAACLPAFAFI